ncbi:hypothetical protein CLOM_g4348 [Closterium sp. NIES-68]|nr:hypothetical protein CLOM_g4348 [Closterium sp. NIES-68]GJP75449.1 hypothetical protein CLOP_g5895 [Closterium sp. NIES-67]GJP83728.1 hypothetical protein CLOP_g13850 [Closterium sp. NIES-67]
MSFFAPFRRSTRRSPLWRIRSLLSRPSIALDSRYKYNSYKLSSPHSPRSECFDREHRIASTSATSPSSSSLYSIGFHPHQPPRNASARIRTPDRSFAIWSAAVTPSRPADAPEAEAAISAGFGPSLGSKPGQRDEAELKTRTVGAEDGESEGGGEESLRRGGKREGKDKEGVDKRGGRRAGAVKGRGEGGGRKGGGREECAEEEEEAAVAVIAGVLMEKFGPQIVREELEEGPGNGRNEDEEEVEEEAKGVGTGIEEDEEEEAEGEAREEDSPAATCRSQRPTSPHYYARATSPSSLLSLYRFFSSHLGISSPSTVASLLASHPPLLRSNPANDFLPRVHLLQSYGISHADIVTITVKSPAWLRSSLPQIQEMLDYLLACGVRRTRLGFVVGRRRSSLCRQAHSTNLDILVERAGVPENKLGMVIERCPKVLNISKDFLHGQLDKLSVYFEDESPGKGEGGDATSSWHLRQHLKPHLNRRSLDGNHLTRLLLRHPRILLASPHNIATNLAILQSFTPPGTPSIAIPALLHASSIFNVSSETLLAKLRFFVELVGETAAGRVVRSHPHVLAHSKENLQGKVAVLSDLLGTENAMRAVARFPPLLTSSEENVRKSFRELVREVEEALKGIESGEEALEGTESGEEALEGIERGGGGEGRLEEGWRGECLEGDDEPWAQNIAEEGMRNGIRREDLRLEEAAFMSESDTPHTEYEGIRSTSQRCKASRALQLVVDLAVRFPPSIYYSWEGNMKHKVEYLKRDMGLSIMEVLRFPTFLSYSLDRRIRSRHVALLHMGYLVVPHDMVYGRKSGDWKERSKGIGRRRRKVELVSEEEKGGQGEVEDGKGEVENSQFDTGKSDSTLKTSSGFSLGASRSICKSAARAGKMVCLLQFLKCPDELFKRRFDLVCLDP